MSQQRFATATARLITRLLRMQAGLAVLVATAVGLLHSVQAAVAVLAGSGIGLALTVFVAFRVLTFPADNAPQDFVRVFSRTMAVKIVLAAVLFAIAASFFSDWYVPIIGGYASSVLAYLLVGLRYTDEDLWPASKTEDEDQHGE
jgi:F0F1-type ATP synthase assembly protein I